MHDPRVICHHFVSNRLIFMCRSCIVINIGRFLSRSPVYSMFKISVGPVSRKDKNNRWSYCKFPGSRIPMTIVQTLKHVLVDTKSNKDSLVFEKYTNQAYQFGRSESLSTLAESSRPFGTLIMENQNGKRDKPTKEVWSKKGIISLFSRR